MIKILSIWLFCIGLILDIPICILKWADWISWDWGVIIVIPFALAIVGTLAFALIYGIIKFFVTLIMWL